MILRFYAVKDVLAGSFMTPNPMVNDNVAKRGLAMAAKDPNAFKDNWRDIQLWYLYSLDTTTGIVSDNVPYLVGNLADYKEVDPNGFKEE